MSLLGTLNRLPLQSKVGFFDFSAAVCIATLPWSLKLNSACIIGFLVLNGILAIRSGQTKRFDTAYFLGASFLFWIACIWLIASSNYTEGFKHLEHSLSLIVFPAVFAFKGKSGQSGIKFIFLTFLASCLLRYFLFVFQVVEVELVLIPDYWKELFLLTNNLFNEKAMHPTYFGMYLGMSGFICFHFYLEEAVKSRKFLWGGLFVLFLLMNLTLAAKAALAGTFLGLLAGMASRIHAGFQKKKLVKGILAILVFGAGTAILLVKVPNSLVQEFNSYYQLLQGENSEDAFEYDLYGSNFNEQSWYTTNRIHIWRAGLNVVKENPLLGVGTGDAEDALKEEFVRRGNTTLAIRNTNTHNQYLDFLVRYGAIGLVAILFFFGRALRVGFLYRNTVFIMFLVLFVTVMMTENILNRQYGIVFFSFFLSGLLFQGSKHASK